MKKHGAAILWLLCTANAQAGLINGTFTNNLNPWVLGPVPGANVKWIQTPGAVIGDGSAVISSTAAGASSSISQPFDCGPGEDGMRCLITYRWKTNLPATDPNGVPTDGGRVTISQGAASTQDDLANTGGQWFTGSFLAGNCGKFTIKFENINGAVFTLDTVTDTCVAVPGPSTAVAALGFVGMLDSRRARRESSANARSEVIRM
ncbi:MAG: hypothetical protein ACREJD_08375 [Phycisphaerales bacterium]